MLDLRGLRTGFGLTGLDLLRAEIGLRSAERMCLFSCFFSPDRLASMRREVTVSDDSVVECCMMGFWEMDM